MAIFRKAKVKQYALNPKTGKVQKVSQTTISGKNADASRVLEASGQNIKATKLGNVREAQRQHHTQEMAKIAGRTTNTANAITQLGLTTQKAIGSLKPIETNVTNSSSTTTSPVDQLVNGGAQPSGSTRDDDRDEDSEWVA